MDREAFSFVARTSTLYWGDPLFEIVKGEMDSRTVHFVDIDWTRQLIPSS